MVQQWLREYRLPGHLSIRDRVRLRQLRFRALQDWGVPTIVALLPLLLQIALILFLAGLCNLLFTLGRTVAITFAAFVGIAMSIYFALVIFPILFRRCPYRNPLSHGALSFFGLLAATTYGAILTEAWLFYMGAYLYVTLAFKALGQFNAPLRHLHDLRQSLIYQMEWVASLGHSFISDRDLWSKRDVSRLSKEADVLRLDCDALACAPSFVSKSKSSSLDHCLQDLPQSVRIECVMTWVSEMLHVYLGDLDVGRSNLKSSIALIFPLLPQTSGSLPILPLIPEFKSVFDSPAILDNMFATRFKGHLLDVLPTRFPPDESGSRYAYSALILLFKLARNGAMADIDSRRAFVRRLVQIVAVQASEHFDNRWACVPSICLYDLVQMHGQHFSESGNVVCFFSLYVR